MGRTVPTFRMVLEHVIHDWQAFRRALRSEDRAAFDAMMLRARQHTAAASNAARLNPSEALFMAVLVEHEKELNRLKNEHELHGKQENQQQTNMTATKNESKKSIEKKEQT